MDYLSDLFQKNPTTDSINLEDREISDLSLLLPLLSKFPNIRELNISENNLTDLPDSLAAFQNLELININNNMFENFEGVIEVLSRLPNLQNLNLNLDNNEQVKLVLDKILNIEYLNNQLVTKEDIEEGSETDLNIIPNEELKQEEAESKELMEQEPPQGIEELELKGEDLEGIAHLYDNIRSVYRKISPEIDSDLAAHFDLSIRDVINTLKTQKDDSQPIEINNTHILAAKFSAYNICLMKIIQFLGTTNNTQMASVLDAVRIGQAGIMDDLRLIIFGLSPQVRGEMSEMQDDLRRSQLETQEVLKAAEGMRAQIEEARAKKEEINMLYMAQSKDMEGQIHELEMENKKYFETIVKHSKAVAHAATPTLTTKQGIQRAKESPAPNDIITPRTFAAQMKRPIPPQIGPTQMRNLTLKQLKDLINDIYIQKQKYEEKCQENHLPSETMEQYMYTYLNQRYGLKTLIIEWASAIINGVKQYSHLDNDISLFGKVLRNECDEDFRFIQIQVKSAIMEILRDKYKRKYRLKSEGDINQAIQKLHGGLIDEWQWREIVTKMYNVQHAKILQDRIREAITERHAAMFNINQRGMTREQIINYRKAKPDSKLPFAEFQKIILDFQLKSHEKFLEKYIMLFKSVDKDTNGVINEEEFEELVILMKICQNDEQIAHLLQLVDPFSNQHITFSQTLALFSTEVVQINTSEGLKGISLLEQFSAQNDSEVYPALSHNRNY